MAPQEAGSRRREVARQLPRAEERNLEGEDVFKSAVCAVGGYLWLEQTDPRGGSHLVGSRLFNPSCFLHNKHSGRVKGTEPQEKCGKQSDWQPGYKIKTKAICSRIHATEEIMAWPLALRAVV